MSNVDCRPIFSWPAPPPAEKNKDKSQYSHQGRKLSVVEQKSKSRIPLRNTDSQQQRLQNAKGNVRPDQGKENRQNPFTDLKSVVHKKDNNALQIKKKDALNQRRMSDTCLHQIAKGMGILERSKKELQKLRKLKREIEESDARTSSWVETQKQFLPRIETSEQFEKDALKETLTLPVSRSRLSSMSDGNLSSVSDVSTAKDLLKKLILMDCNQRITPRPNVPSYGGPKQRAHSIAGEVTSLPPIHNRTKLSNQKANKSSMNRRRSVMERKKADTLTNASSTPTMDDARSLVSELSEPPIPDYAGPVPVDKLNSDHAVPALVPLPSNQRHAFDFSPEVIRTYSTLPSIPNGGKNKNAEFDFLPLSPTSTLRTIEIGSEFNAEAPDSVEIPVDIESVEPPLILVRNEIGEEFDILREAGSTENRDWNNLDYHVSVDLKGVDSKDVRLIVGHNEVLIQPALKNNDRATDVDKENEFFDRFVGICQRVHLPPNVDPPSVRTKIEYGFVHIGAMTVKQKSYMTEGNSHANIDENEDIRITMTIPRMYNRRALTYKAITKHFLVIGANKSATLRNPAGMTELDRFEVPYLPDHVTAKYAGDTTVIFQTSKPK